ncbi:MAG: AAA family ATPase [Candidatus Methanomethylicaceae archaeon]|jgi:5-methylcytosine-specific restriction protein B
MSENDFHAQYNQLRTEGRLEFITFHPSYSYEEFIEGITVNTDQGKAENNGEISYIRKWGIFKKICTLALAKAIGENLNGSLEPWEDQWRSIFEKYQSKVKGKLREAIRNDIWDKAEDFVLIIDEINRGDASKIFGELVTLLEKDKRLAQENEIVVRLPYSNDEFSVPPNLHIIGTMNTADRSIALVDIALRRRFGFVEVPPDFDILRSNHMERNKAVLQQNDVYQYLSKSIDAVTKINGKIIKELGRDKQIGHSFFFRVFDQGALMRVWQYEILPLLEEYFDCDYDKILQALEVTEQNLYINNRIGIKGFTKIEELDSFLDLVLNKAGSTNG